MNDLYVVPSFAGPENGTKDNPFAVTNSAEFDTLMRQHAPLDQLAVHLSGGQFRTVGTREWEDSNNVQENPGFRLGRHWTFDLEPDSVLQWDFGAIPDDQVSDTPIHVILSTEARFDARVGLHTPQEVWDLLPRGQAVRGGAIDLQFTKAVDRWKALGKKLRIGAVLLSGHEAAIEGVRTMNGGTLGSEGFPLVITGAVGSYDRNLIAQLDSTHVFDADLPDLQCSHITNCPFDGFDETATNDQVTVRMIVGNMGERAPGVWQQHMRAYAYQRGNTTIAKGKNLVQAHTIYQVLRGDIDHNTSQGAAVGVYGDFYATKGLHVWLNQFLDTDYAGIRFPLSPGGVGNMAEQFSHERYEIGPNQITSKSGVQVEFDTFEHVMPTSATRYIRDMRVDASLVLDNKGATGVVRTGTQRTGCNRLPFLNR